MVMKAMKWSIRSFKPKTAEMTSLSCLGSLIFQYASGMKSKPTGKRVGRRLLKIHILAVAREMNSGDPKAKTRFALV
jgi:hypothetical protein